MIGVQNRPSAARRKCREAHRATPVSKEGTEAYKGEGLAQVSRVSQGHSWFLGVGFPLVEDLLSATAVWNKSEMGTVVGASEMALESAVSHSTSQPSGY